MKNLDDYLPLFDDLIEKNLKEEKETYHNDLLSFDQYAAQIKEQMRVGEKQFLKRMQRAVQLLESQFGKQKKLSIFIKV